VKKITDAAEAGNQDESIDDSSWRSRRRPAVPLRSGALLLGRGETILLVDTGTVMRGELARLLRQLGYRVKEASGAVEAQHLAHDDRRVQLLLLDLSAPEANDLELALWFRVMYPKTKVLLTVGSLWDLNSHVGHAAEFAFLSKPFTPIELARVLRRILD
jgi:DNA-binding NtrC family response regulator